MTSGSAQSSFAGVVPPLCTPLDASCEVDEASLAALVDHVLAAGADGLFVLGSSGEAAYLTDRQRARVVKAALTACRGRVPVWVGLVDTTAARVIDQGRAVADPAIAGYVVTAPFYARFSSSELRAHYRTVSAGLGQPVVAYNIPSNVNRPLLAHELAQLAGEGVVLGVKDSSGDLATMRQLLRALGRECAIPVLTGSEALIDASLAMGASGVVAGLANVDPGTFVRLYRCFQAADTVGVAREQETILELARLYDLLGTTAGVNASQLGAVKVALQALGVISHATLSVPMTAVPPAGAADVRSLLVQLGYT